MISLEIIVVIQIYVGSNVVRKKWIDFKEILEVKLIEIGDLIGCK